MKSHKEEQEQKNNQKYPYEDENSEESIIFTKDNVKYYVDITFHDGAVLRNYDDDQYPVVPFAHYKLKYFDNKEENKNYNGKMRSSRSLKDKLLDKKISNSLNENNELKKKLEFSNLQKKINELEENVFIMNRDNYKRNRRNRNSKYANMEFKFKK